MTEATKITPELLRAMPLPQPAGSTDKQARGSVLVVAGSVEVPGAALLAGTAALRAGAGKLQIATCSSVALHMALAVPEARVTGLPETPEGGIAPEAAEILCERAKRNDAVLLGPGMMDKDAVAGLTTGMVKGLSGPVLVLDAEALVCLDTLREALCSREGRTIITPHSGEMASLLEIGRDAVEEDPLAIARQVATRFQVVVALKGGTTHIVDPDGDCWFYESGNVGLATSGSGDTLAGVVAGLVARGAGPAHATIWAVYLHGQAGNRLARSRGPMGFLARELLAEIPSIMAELAQ
jgi:ADP-dependent NAD(P)H-hydrate dehydratase